MLISVSPGQYSILNESGSNLKAKTPADAGTMLTEANRAAWPLLTHLEFRIELRNSRAGLISPLDSAYSMNIRDFISSRAHHDHHNLTPGFPGMKTRQIPGLLRAILNAHALQTNPLFD